MCCAKSRKTGTAISAAAVGVGARRSAAKSISVVSVSWPTAEISGMDDSAAARTTISSLNGNRSSNEPPPRATISTSGRAIPFRGSALNPRIAAAISLAARSPCTLTGQSSTRRGQRSLSRCMISRITAPVGELTTPMTAGKNGIFFFRAESNRPSAASFFFLASSMAMSAPTPASSISSTMI